MEIDERTLERIKEAVDWLASPVRISIDKREIHVVLSMSVGDPTHYGLHASRPEDPVVEFVDMLVSHRAKSVSITFKKTNVVDEVRMEHRDDCLVIHNAKDTPLLDICTLMEALKVDRSTASRAFNRITRGEERQICLTYPRKKWVLSQRG